ncbi:putative ulp1 protease family, C-terminal catalytic domain [Lyophyllum shimeji]|uniref:Ulp1 protease family, C-terminal catalytic domain n=1 Tax=Lyophyllum shimeji TaxID=47721 RepID=A0A9P3PJD9_LYOSH|nr:putative ulp1 protease family, C-terminal catalytic domain [Lyophyllum shimeji]
MRKKCAVGHKPVLLLSKMTGTVALSHFMYTILATSFIATLASLESTVQFLKATSREHGPRVTTLGMLFLVFEVAIGIVALITPRRLSPLLVLGLEKRRYHRAHVSHMRIDRMRALVRKHTVTSSWARFAFLGIWFLALFGTLKSQSLSPITNTSLPTFVRHLPSTSTEHLSSTFPVHIHGGGDDPSASSPVSLTMDLTMVDETNARRVPEWVSEHFPILNSHTSVLDLLNTPIPPTATIATALMPFPCYAPPNIFLSQASTAADVFRDHAGLFWDLAHHSSFTFTDFQDPIQSIRLGSNPHRYSLWVGTLVNNLRQQNLHRTQWEGAVEWLNELAFNTAAPIETPDIVDECRRRLAVVPWQGVISGFGRAVQFTSWRLASFLGIEWLDDEMINAGSEWISKRLGPAKGGTRIVNCLHMQQLQHARQSGIPYIALIRLDKLISSRSVDRLFLPLLVFGNHWTLLRIDLRDNTYSYADCLHHKDSPPPEVLDLIQWWIAALLPGNPPLTRTPFKFKLPHQTDGFSCGIIVLCLMASILLHETHWSPERAVVHRMEWFLRLSDDYDVPEESDSNHGDNATQSLDLPNLGDVSDSDDDSDDECDTTDALPSSPVPHKRSSSVFSTQSDSEASDSCEGRRIRRKRSGAKPGSSWAAQKATRDRTSKSDVVPVKGRLRTFRQKIYDDDPRAEFQDNKLLLVRCSACAEWLTMRALYDARRWKDHRATKKCKKNCSSGLATRSLFTLGFGKCVPTSQCHLGTQPLPCPGLSRHTDFRIDRYMSRTSATGGGAPSRRVIAKQLFDIDDVLWKDLDDAQRKMVIRREEVLQRWKISRSADTVYSSSCESTVHTAPTTEPQACSECCNLYNVHTFLVAISRPMPDEANMKFVPKSYRCAELGEIYLKYKGVRQLVEKDDGRSPWLKFAQGVVDGVYQSETLLGMVEALYVKAERIRKLFHSKGKSLQNMKYSAAFSNFCTLLASTSTRAYQTFKRHFGGRVMSSIRKIRAKMPRIRPGISGYNVSLALDVIERLNYSGPIGLSWDDTDLEPAISIYQESKETCMVIGSVNEELCVKSHEDIQRILENARLKPADKLRIWLLTIPLPKIPPILVAAVARGAKSNADALLVMHNKLTDLLHEHGIHPVSNASDGTEVERQTQQLVAASAPSHHIYVIPNKSLGTKGSVCLRIPLDKGVYPMVNVQDSKHALKTARNQLFTGARILVMGFFPAFYAQLRELALNPAGPLFTRDVEGVDRQDDRAAGRTFSSPALDFQMKTSPEQRGLSVYLFILGELIDAWQNRSISHALRAKMALRARFFLLAWRAHILAHPNYSVHVQFISRESFDIFITVAESLLALIIVYRTYYSSFPLLPWLHSTEPCEHVFGVMRQIKKDFTFSDMLSAEPKLRTLLLGAFGDLSAEEQANQTAAGYHHTYFNADDLDLKELLCYPTEDDLAAASDAAFEEAKQLLGSLGINAADMLTRDVVPPKKKLRAAPATISKGPQTLLQLFALYRAPPATSKAENELEACELALVAENVDRSLSIDDLPDSTGETLDELKATIESHLEVLPSATSPTVKSSDTSPLSFVTDNRLNREILVSERKKHETRFTAKAVRQNGRALALPLNDRTFDRFVTKGATLREALLLHLHSVAPEAPSPSNATTSGINRQVRHTGTFADPSSSRSETTQSKNKATVRMAAAMKFIRIREQAFESLRGIHDNFPFANITAYSPLQPEHLVIALRPLSGKDDSGEVILGQVITMYSKGEGKSARHEWITSADSLGILSNVYVRLFAPFGGENMFTSMACRDLASSTILQIPRTHILLSLASSTKALTWSDIQTASGHPLSLLTLCPFSTSIFQQFSRRRDELYAGLKVLKKRMKEKDQGDVCGNDAKSEDGQSDSEADLGLE